MSLHCLDYRPSFYNFVKGDFDRYLEQGMFTDLTKATTKSIYTDLVDEKFLKPRIVRLNPTISFKMAWQVANNKFLDPEIRSCAYKITHDVLPTNIFLFNYTTQRFSHCTFCGRKYEETISHLLIKCPQALKVWEFAKKYFWNTCNHRLKISEELVKYNTIAPELKTLPQNLTNIFYEIINLAKFAIWTTRCEVKYDHKNFDDDSSLRTFLSKLRFRIRVDAERHKDDLYEFRTSWGLKKVLFTHDPYDNIVFNF